MVMQRVSHSSPNDIGTSDVTNKGSIMISMTS